MLSHLNALTFVNWGCETFGITANDRLSDHAPFNFDLWVFDIFVAVKAGAAISLVPEGLAVFPLQLSSFIQDQKITVLVFRPDGAGAPAGARETRKARSRRPSLGSLCRSSFSDQAPADADGKATTPSLCQPLRTDRNECLRLL